MLKRYILLLTLASVCISCAGPGSRTETRAAGESGTAGSGGEHIPTGIEVGQRAPEILLPNPDGKEIALSSLQGKVVLVDFWASWCGPCRRENPNIAAQYQKYKDKGFTVYSVSLDMKKEDWARAIEKDGLAWPNHVSDLKFWYSEPAAVYRIDAIPANFLLDEEGVILAKNLYGDQLGAYLNKLFTN